MDWEMWPFRPSGCWTQSGDLLTPDSLMVLHPSSKSGHSNCIPQEGLLCRAPILQEEAQTVMAACSSPCSALHTAGSDTSAASVCRLLAGCELDLGWKDADTELDLDTAGSGTECSKIQAQGPSGRNIHSATKPGSQATAPREDQEIISYNLIHPVTVYFFNICNLYIFRGWSTLGFLCLYFGKKLKINRSLSFIDIASSYFRKTN